MHITSRSCCLQNLGTNNSTLEWSYMGRKTIEKGCLRRWLRLRRLQVSGHRPHDIRDNPLPCQKKAVILHSHSKASHVHRTFIARSSRYHRTYVHVQYTSEHGVFYGCRSIDKRAMLTNKKMGNNVVFLPIMRLIDTHAYLRPKSAGISPQWSVSHFSSGLRYVFTANQLSAR